MATKKLGLTRDQLAQFLTDFEQIRQFERLFSTVETLETADASEIEALAGSASARAVQALDTLARLQDTVDLLASAPPPAQPVRARYGSFYDTTTQTVATPNTEKLVTFNTTDLSSGVRVGSTTSQIIADEAGVYNFQTSVQLDKTSGGTALWWLWWKKNGSTVSDSASEVQIQGNNAEIFVALNYFFDLAAGDYVELAWAANDTSVQLQARPAVAPVPGIPSVILTVSNNIEGVKQ